MSKKTVNQLHICLYLYLQEKAIDTIHLPATSTV